MNQMERGDIFSMPPHTKKKSLQDAPPKKQVNCCIAPLNHMNCELCFSKKTDINLVSKNLEETLFASPYTKVLICTLQW